MEAHEYSTIFGFAIVGILGYFLRDAHAQVKALALSLESLRKDFSVQSLVMATEFVRKNEMREVEMQIDKFSEVLFGKIDRLNLRLDERFEQLSTKIDLRIENVSTRFETQIEAMNKQVQYKQDKVKA